MVSIPSFRRSARRRTSTMPRSSSIKAAALVTTLLSLPASICAKTITIHNGTLVDIDVGYYPPATSAINTLEKVLGLEGSYGFMFNGSDSGPGQYGRYNYCNMPHVRKAEYTKPGDEYRLYYAELISRHHKGTPEQTSMFPVEPEKWNCDDTGNYVYSQPFPGRASAMTYLSNDEGIHNPFAYDGYHGTCSFPQISGAGLSDAWQHGRDVHGVYHDQFTFLPHTLDKTKTLFRVTNHAVTSQTAGAFIKGLYMLQSDVSVSVQRESIDSLEPRYPCPAADELFANIASTLDDSPWKEHLVKGRSILDELDIVAGVPSEDQHWHNSFAPYFDNLASRTCHSKKLPCSANDTLMCVTPTLADSVFRMGQYEYSYLYRDHPDSLPASIASFGVWVAELAQHLRDKVSAVDSAVIFRQHFAHVGSLARLLSILQTDVMVLPGMGAEISFEMWVKRPWDERNIQLNHHEPRDPQDFYVRVLWGGRPLRSSNPTLGTLDMVPLETVLAYFDELVGVRGEKVPALCRGGR